MNRVAVALVGLLAGCHAPAPQGDPARGQALHQSCLQCHGTEAYVAPQRRVGSLEELRKATARWGDMYNPALKPEEVEDLVAYLNRDFYRFVLE
jgi:mono/diheme cytochrome c family protein